MGIKERFVKKKIAKLTRNISHKAIVPNIEVVKSIGVLWQPSQKEGLNYLKNYFNREHMIFRSFCVFEEDANPHPDANTLTVKDLNFWGLPKMERINDFVDMQFDILFNIALKQNLPLEYITLLSKAYFKTGWSPEENNYFDLNINIGKKQDTMFLVKQQIFYIVQLNKKITE
ncbi:MAG: hypothetical protein CR996_01680 [Draconibacterium sp.]|nr:MAG: hypothetical protein CR996_01680 [Draconibacterium sp.]PIF06168.1 MAG: hypothetical protein CSA36_03015 [Draconibacterium sp.]